MPKGHRGRSRPPVRGGSSRPGGDPSYKKKAGKNEQIMRFFDEDEEADEGPAAVVPSRLSERILDLARKEGDGNLSDFSGEDSEGEGGAAQDESWMEDINFDDVSAEDLRILRNLGVAPTATDGSSGRGSAVPPAGRTIADFIAAAAPAGDVESGPLEGSEDASTMDTAAVKTFMDVGKVLKTYATGRLPKAVLILPSLARWEEVLQYTRPGEWSANAHKAVCRLFSRSPISSDHIAQRYFHAVLLPAVRKSIKDSESKKLHAALYRAISEATYRPSAFFRGFLFPLAAGADESTGEPCTLREATIISGVLKVTSFPVRHAAVALVTLSSLPPSPAVTLFLRVLVEKGYSLPYRVIDALGSHFWSFYGTSGSEPLPLAWHVSLLSFVSRYKDHLLPAQATFLRRLIVKQKHPLISPQILRELDAASATTTRASRLSLSSAASMTCEGASMRE